MENSFKSLFGETPRVKLSKPTQSKPNPICDRSGKPEDTERVFVDKGKTSRSHEIDEKRLHKERGSSDRTGKPVKLSEDIRVMHAHDGTGEPVKSGASTQIVKDQFVLAEHRDIASFNADNEFNRATDEENIDFNIPGVPNSTVKRSHGVNVHNLCQCSTYTETPTQHSVSSHTRTTPRTRVGALSRCHPGHRDTPVGPGRTPTVHRCPKGEAVGGPNTNTTHVVRRSTEHITTMLTW